MFKTQERLFARLHKDGLLLEHYAEEYDFHPHRLTQSDRAAGAMRWTMIPRRGAGPTITSAYTVTELCRHPVVRYTDIYGRPTIDFEILPAD